MSKDLQSHFAAIEDLDSAEWTGTQRKIRTPLKALREIGLELGNVPAAGRLLGCLEEIETRLYRLECVSTAIDRELLDVSQGIDGLVKMLCRLDDVAISAGELHCLTKPLAMQLGQVVSHHNALNG